MSYPSPLAEAAGCVVARTVLSNLDATVRSIAGRFLAPAGKNGMSTETSRSLPQNVIPFVLAASGHRDLMTGDLLRLREEVSQLLSRMKQRMPTTPLLLLTGLAEGADQLVADEALKLGAYLAVVLPMPQEVYRRTLSEPAQIEFDRLLLEASLVILLDHRSSGADLSRQDEQGEKARGQQYSELARFLALHCQALIALWDGEDSGKRGGTFEVVRSVLSGVEYENCMEPLRGTVYQVVTPRQCHATRIGDVFDLHVLRCPSDADEFTPAIPLVCKTGSEEEIEKAKDAEASSITAEELKQWRLVPREGIRAWLFRAAIGASGSQVVEPSPTERSLEVYNREAALLEEVNPPMILCPSEWKGTAWSYLKRIDHCQRRANAIALRCQTTKRNFLRWILGSAFLAAAGLMSHAHLLHEVDLMWFVFPFFMTASGVIYLVARHENVENRFLDARVLAEALRVQYYWELGGVRLPVWQYYLAHRPSELGWVISALRGLSLLRFEESQTEPPCAGDVRTAISAWVGGQAKWFADRSGKQRGECSRREERGNLILLGVVFVSFVVGVLMFLPFPALDGLRRFLSSYRGLIHLAIAMGSVWVALENVVLENEGYDEQARNYKRMSHLFIHRKEKLDELLPLSQVPDSTGPSANAGDAEARVACAIEVLREVGVKALEENGIWLMMHREHPLKVTGAS